MVAGNDVGVSTGKTYDWIRPCDVKDFGDPLVGVIRGERWVVAGFVPGPTGGWKSSKFLSKEYGGTCPDLMSFDWVCKLSEWEGWFQRFLTAMEELAEGIVGEIASRNNFVDSRTMFASGSYPTDLDFGITLDDRTENAQNVTLTLAALLNTISSPNMISLRKSLMRGFKRSGWPAGYMVVEAMNKAAECIRVSASKVAGL